GGGGVAGCCVGGGPCGGATAGEAGTGCCCPGPAEITNAAAAAVTSRVADENPARTETRIPEKLVDRSTPPAL
ncbi:MAG TPA: hypothetical protein VHM88_07820, partial [Candidatus Acidoferrales bacterium]|nr:hypothetical protein [Candidatus Acidoferrales bacterium]